jgi:predicted acylesterase/phospholipase RssA
MKQVPLPPKRRPVVGIALGAGVARGWTHIGVLRTLRKAGIEPDIISGTSIGALVGGCEAAGKLDVLEEFARSLTRRRMLSLLDFRFRSSGLIGDAKLREIMHTHLADLNIEDMERRFVGVATELTTGHELWLHEGGLIDSIRASYALPGVFSPVSVDGRWLIDGALVNPVPVSVALPAARAMWAASPSPITARRRKRGPTTSSWRNWKRSWRKKNAPRACAATATANPTACRNAFTTCCSAGAARTMKRWS